jgi:hypothetical protein
MFLPFLFLELVSALCDVHLLVEHGVWFAFEVESNVSPIPCFISALSALQHPENLSATDTAGY